MSAGDRALWTLTHGHERSVTSYGYEQEWRLVNVANCHDVLRYRGERGRRALSMALLGAAVWDVDDFGGITVSIKAEQLVAVRDAAVISL